MLHPSMGIGGAERLTLDAAIGLRRLGHRPTIFTRELPLERSFEGALDGSAAVRVLPTRIPASVGGRLKAPLSVARMSTMARALQPERGNFDVAWADLVSHAVPALRASLRRPVFFYCHYPDLLLTPPRTGLYSLYRRPLDVLEHRGLRAAARVAVNSRFTAGKFRDVFPDLPAPDVIYPGIEIPDAPRHDAPEDHEEIVLLSINRFSRDKNLPLAIHALAALRESLPPALYSRVKLVLAGACNPSQPEERRSIDSLARTAAERQVAEQLITVSNPRDAELRRLLARCRCVVYTPENEHFGLGPLEAMAAGKPVIAADSGGPRETILDEHCGRLRPADPAAFADAIAPWVLNPEEATRMGRAGRENVTSRFSRERFCRDLEAILLSMVE